jgi:hypothetical protein
MNSSQRCIAVSIGTCTAVARFLGVLSIPHFELGYGFSGVWVQVALEYPRRNPHSRHCHTRSTSSHSYSTTHTHAQMSCPPLILTFPHSHSHSAYHTHTRSLALIVRFGLSIISRSLFKLPGIYMNHSGIRIARMFLIYGMIIQ